MVAADIGATGSTDSDVIEPRHIRYHHAGLGSFGTTAGAREDQVKLPLRDSLDIASINPCWSPTLSHRASSHTNRFVFAAST